MSARSDIGTLPAGTVLLTYGKGYPFRHAPWRGSFWEELGKELICKQIRDYQLKQGYVRHNATHVRLITAPGIFIEATYPRVRQGFTRELFGKEVCICRPRQSFDIKKAIEWAYQWEGQMYDVPELLDFAVSGLLRLKFLRFGVLDRPKRYVCSTLVSGAFNEGGFQWDIKWSGVSPAHYENRPQLFNTEYKIADDR